MLRLVRLRTRPRRLHACGPLRPPSGHTGFHGKNHQRLCGSDHGQQSEQPVTICARSARTNGGPSKSTFLTLLSRATPPSFESITTGHPFTTPTSADSTIPANTATTSGWLSITSRTPSADAGFPVWTSSPTNQLTPCTSAQSREKWPFAAAC